MFPETNFRARLLLLISAIFAANSLALTYFDTDNNLIYNPGFEIGTTSWNTAGGQVTPETAYEGTYSGKLPYSTSNQDWRTNAYTAEPGKSYQLIFYYKTSAGASGNPQVRMRFHQGGAFKGEAQKTLALTNGQWEKVVITGTCPAQANNLDVFYTTNRFGSFSGDTWIDSVSVYPEVTGEQIAELYSPKDGMIGWAHSTDLKWPENQQATAYLVYIGTEYDQVDSAEFTYMPADINFDSKVNISDFAILASQWHKSPDDTYPAADIDNNEIIDLGDLGEIAAFFTSENTIPSGYYTHKFNTELNIDLPESIADYYWRVDPIIDGQPVRGETMFFNCEDYLDYGINVPTNLYSVHIDRLSKTGLITFQSLQGVIARTRPALYIRTNWNSQWLIDMITNYGVKHNYIESLAGSKDPLEWALDEASSYYSRYILCDTYNDPSSLTAAISLAAAITEAIVIDISDQQLMTDRNVPLYADTRGFTEKDVWDNFKDNFTKKAIFVQRDDINSHGTKLRDLPIAINALTWWHSSLSATEEVFQEYRKNIPCYGWDSPVATGEGNAVKFHSQHSMYTVVTDWSLNLSTYAGMASVEPEITFSQPCSDNVYTPEDNVHYVTFILSDMDNANVIFDYAGWAANTNRYASPHRGQFAMGWGMPPAMLKLGPSVMKWWYRNATEQDCFIGYCSGMDYFNPAHFPDLDVHTSHLKNYLEDADLSTMLIIDGLMPQETLSQDYYETAKYFTRIDKLHGLFYMEYMQYAPYDGKLYWFDDKPMVTARFDYRTDRFYSRIRTTAQELADSINAMPADPYSESGYSFVTVHAWSKGWNEVADCIALLNSNVRIVNPNEFIEQIYMHNVGR